MRNDTTTCAIIGGGPAGMVLGLLLARQGVQVTVLEKHADFLRDFRGDTVHPTTLDLLDELGLGERFAALPHTRLERMAFPLPGGGEVSIADFTRLELRHPYIAMVPQWDLLNLLAEAGRDEPTFTLRMSTEVTGLLRDGDRITGVRYRDRAGFGELRAELTVACDGRWSLARQEAGLQVREWPVGFDVWWFKLPVTSGPGASLLPRIANGKTFGLIPREGYVQVAHFIPKGADASLRARGLDAFRRDLLAAVPEAAVPEAAVSEAAVSEAAVPEAAEVSATADSTDGATRKAPEVLASWDDVRMLDVRLNRLRRWHQPGLLCIGDAAHAMSPAGGVGINLAVQDAVATATLLAKPLRRHRLTGKDLDAVRRRRLLPTAVTQTMQRILHRALMGPIITGKALTPPNPLVALLKLFPPLSAVPARLIGVGIRPEHAPFAARRAPGEPRRG
ncbi:FAD-dependent oxidoreductase [Nonomuraea sp. PA05]|uniref:FAD-dependent oxidoreductase n=1 Tax=Nonomuraea sp. PA05 TaxID=2604466 RepID=UPI0011DBD143|nr:FAD-dependent oxidoreductase [Nonomuraea sp. PA05]TYB56133.1 FAD-dependent oxidoreductase [Nonomuraea sp. PA05]